MALSRAERGLDTVILREQDASDWERLEPLFEELNALSDAARAARLEVLWAEDAALAEELASLVACAPHADDFFRQLPRAAAAVAAELVSSGGDWVADRTGGGWTDDHPGATVAQYRIEDVLGRGGMGVVYRATDTRLNRLVALKFLPPHRWVDRQARERLLLEARAVAGLDHPNICTVHGVGETPDGVLFLAMTYYEGETLRERLTRGPLNTGAAADIATQAARALAAAHGRGIVHRDVKPANLMLTPAGAIKLLDFGLAQFADVTATASGQTPGTIAYMSPEQVRGERADARTDLWALGVVLFEMVTGRRPFRGDSQAAVLHAILNVDPPAVSRLRGDLAVDLDDIVARLLRRDRQERYPSALALLEDLERIGSPAAGPRRRARSRAANWTKIRWRKHRRVASIVVAGIVVAGVTAWAVPRLRSPERAAPANAGDRVLIADFTASADDSTLGAVVSHALRLGLARSSTLRVTGATTVSAALQRMRRAPDEPLDPSVAREVAVREGIKAVIQGDVRRVGGGYLLTAAMEDAATGDRIEGWDLTAGDSTEIPLAIGRLIAKIRAGSVSPLASLDPRERPSRLTTSSLGALRKHREGMQAFLRGDYRRAMVLFEEASVLDPDFAYAHSLLGTTLLTVGVRDSRVQRAFRRAYELRAQLTVSERYGVEGLRAKHVLGDIPRAIDALRKHVEATRGTGAGIWYGALADALMTSGRYSEAEAALHEARRFWSTGSNQAQLVNLLVRRGDELGAINVLAEAQARHPRHPLLVGARAALEARSGDYAAAHAIVDTGLVGPGARQAPRTMAMLDATRGRIREAIDHLRALQQDDIAAGHYYEAAHLGATIGLLRIDIDGPSDALTEVERLLAALPESTATGPIEYPYLSLAIFFASAGRPLRGEAMVQEYLLAVPPDLRAPDQWLQHRALAAIRLAQGQPRAALAELRAAHPPGENVGPFDARHVPVDDYPELARIYDRLGMSDSTLAVYERYLAARDLDRITMDALELGRALERVAELSTARADWRRAGTAYRSLAELWRDADPELQSVATRASERATAFGAH